ncbi:hypothetical protein CTAYLR_003643 [Chrysophaeum taylorii]|uniref:Peptidase M3A/M3B catalytic domain-containing protein n=1 Tax=Chrysophaeum taylorii TaxID=2483200 RepID=A0AAD7UDE5_9STRA|nr:hypothetical protein CTAYLR_003643 [Chrysophaeum taylorii]
MRRTAAEIEGTVEAIVGGFESSVAGIVEQPAAARTWASTAGALSAAIDQVARMSGECTVPALVAGDDATRAAGAAAKQALTRALASAFARRELYDAARSSEGETRDEALVSRKVIALFEARGLHLDDAATIAVEQAEIARLCAEFEQRINEDGAAVMVTREELAGLPEAFVDSLPRRGEVYEVGLKAPQLTPVLQLARNRETRRKAYAAAATRCPENLDRLARILELRRSVAARLGHPSHASCVLRRDRMAGSPERVDAFVAACARKLAPLVDRDAALLRDEARRDGIEELRPWDTAYYGRIVREELGVDEEKLKPYFPAATVVPAALDVLATLLDLNVERVRAPDLEWHHDCEVYKIFSSSDDDDAAFVVLDLFPRPRKFGHQMVVPIRPKTASGEPGVCCVLGNVGDANRLLRFREVETLLHEFGHVFHFVCSCFDPKPALASWAWPIVPYPGGVEMDYLEVPSMFAQNFAYAPAVLERLSRHQTTGDSLPAETRDQIAKHRHLLAGITKARYLAMCDYDLSMHGPRRHDAPPATLWPPIYERYTGLLEHPDTHFATTWYHVAIGYDSTYYSYLWSEVAAVDIFSAFGDQGDLDKSKGRRLRDALLTPGATRSGEDMIRAFLGRDANDDAFFDRLLATLKNEED